MVLFKTTYSAITLQGFTAVAPNLLETIIYYVDIWFTFQMVPRYRPQSVQNSERSFVTKTKFTAHKYVIQNIVSFVETC